MSYGGGGLDPSHGGPGARQDWHYIEEENEDLTTQLRSKVKTLKSVSSGSFLKLIYLICKIIYNTIS